MRTDSNSKSYSLIRYFTVNRISPSFLQGHSHTLSAVQFNHTGDQVVTCGRDQTLKCWEVATGYCVRTLSGHSDWVKCLSISLDGELLASGSHDQSIVLWRLSTGQKLQVIYNLILPIFNVLSILLAKHVSAGLIVRAPIVPILFTIYQSERYDVSNAANKINIHILIIAGPERARTRHRIRLFWKETALIFSLN